MKKLMIVALGCMIASGALAESKPFQASLTPDIAIHSKDTHIKGVTLNIWGENPQSAFALGFVNGSTGDSAGLSLGLFNYAENYKGVQWGFVNCTRGNFVGWQDGFVNHAVNMTGLQSGVVNIADTFKGVQLGAVNYAKAASSGIQIGAINIISQNEWFSGFPQELAKGMVFVNWRFE
jgi:hypothetical protein